MYKKIALMTLAVFAVGSIYLSPGKQVEAACECIQRTPAPLGNAYLDSSGNVIPDSAYGVWTGDKVDPVCAPFVKIVGPPAGFAFPACYQTAVPGVTSVRSDVMMEGCACNVYTQGYVKTWFRVPTLGDLIGNIIRLIFFIAGLYALILLLLGGFEWVSSGGDDKKLEGARGKIINAIIGLVVMVAVLTLVIVLEQVVFGGKVCLGISCPINMGDLRIIK